MRTRTSPELKWLLNERAALAGRIARLPARLREAEAEFMQLSAVAAAKAVLIESLRDGQRQVEQRLAALDHTMNLLAPELDPAAAGEVRAQAGRYGQRGGLQQFVCDVLRAAYPHTLTTAELTTLVIGRFQLEVDSRKERKRVTGQVYDACRELRDNGVLAQIPSPGRNLASAWHWKSPPSLTDLHALGASPA